MPGRGWRLARCAWPWNRAPDLPLVAWLHRSKRRGVDRSRSAAWPIVVQTLVRWLAQQTEPAPAEASLRRSLERTAVLTSRLTHDFGNYLTGILGFTELTLTQVPGGTLPHRYLQEVLQSARQGAEWIRRLHWFCRRSEQSTWPAELTSVIEESRARLPAGLGAALADDGAARPAADRHGRDVALDGAGGAGEERVRSLQGGRAC